MDQKRFDQISRTLATGLSRRGVLRVLGVGGASGLLAVVGQAVRAADRPHERLQDRSEQRNRKQRRTPRTPTTSPAASTSTRLIIIGSGTSRPRSSTMGSLTWLSPSGVRNTT